MMIDPTITVGNLIEIGAIVGGGLLAIITLRGKVITLTGDMTDMKAEIKKIGQVLITMAVYENRLTNLEKDVRELRHGEGFIFPLKGRESP